MKVKMQLDIGEHDITLFINEGCLKSGSRDKVDGKPILEIFPNANDENTVLGSLGVDFSKGIVKVLSDDEFDRRFPQDEENKEGGTLQ